MIPCDTQSLETYIAFELWAHASATQPAGRAPGKHLAAAPSALAAPILVLPNVLSRKFFFNRNNNAKSHPEVTTQYHSWLPPAAG